MAVADAVAECGSRIEQHTTAEMAAMRQLKDSAGFRYLVPMLRRMAAGKGYRFRLCTYKLWLFEVQHEDRGKVRQALQSKLIQ